MTATLPNECEEPEWFVDAICATPEVDQISVNGCPVMSRRWGQPRHPGIVLVHGSGAHSRWWDHIAPLLAQDFSVTAVDLSGHGDSGRRLKYGWDEWAAEILVICAHMSCDTPIVIGHSMGGWATVHAAADPRAELGGIVIVDTALGPTWATGQAAWVSSASRPHRVYSSEAEALARFRLRPTQQEMLPYVFDHIAKTSIREVPGGWSWKFDPRTRERKGEVGAETLSRVRCPVAVIRAEHGRLAADAGQWFEEALGKPTPIIDIPRAHHHVMVDQPLVLVRALRELLSGWAHDTAGAR